jgi:hypothetical protein
LIRRNMYVLIHSPLVGPLTWSLVAEEMRKRDLDVMIPRLQDTPGSEEPFWKQHAQSVAAALTQIPADMPVTLVAHSGAGPLLPAIRQEIPNPVRACVFVDASIPHNGKSRLDLMAAEDPAWAAEFRRELERGERFPAWNFDDLADVLPDEALRRQIVAELRPRGLDFFTEPIPVLDGWPDALCIYIQFTASYEEPAARARKLGWPTYKLEAGHFHMLFDVKTVTDMITGIVAS